MIDTDKNNCISICICCLGWSHFPMEHSWKSIRRGFICSILATFVIIKPLLLTGVDVRVIPTGAWYGWLSMASEQVITILQPMTCCNVHCCSIRVCMSASASVSTCLTFNVGCYSRPIQFQYRMATSSTSPITFICSTWISPYVRLSMIKLLYHNLCSRFTQAKRLIYNYVSHTMNAQKASGTLLSASLNKSSVISMCPGLFYLHLFSFRHH